MARPEKKIHTRLPGRKVLTMAGLIGSIIDHGLMLLVFGWLAYHHSGFNKKTPTEKKKEWAAGLGCLLVLYHGTTLVMDLAKERPPANALVVVEKPPTPEEITALFKSAGKSVTEELPIAIPNGPIITLPKGYGYVIPPTGNTRLLAGGKNHGSVYLMRIDQYGDLATLEKALRAEMKPDGDNILGPSNREMINGCESLVMTIRNPKKDFNGYVLLTSNGKVAYYLLVGAPKSIEKAVQAEHFRVLHSLAAADR